MKSILRGLGFLTASLVIGELVRRILMSRPGGAVADKLGRPGLATYEGATAVGKEAKRAIGLVKTLTGPKPKPEEARVIDERQPGWVGLARDASEMLLSAGALLKVASDFVGEDRKLKKRIQRPKYS